GHVFAGIPRKLLLHILQARCAELGVAVHYQTEVSALARLDACDLLIAADGINSVARAAHAAVFQPSIELGRAKYIWLGTDLALDAFTFLFRENDHGFFQVHAYPFGGATSTFIVECDEATWQRAGLDTADEAASLAYCARLFADDLRGSRLFSNASKWISFPTVKNRTWRHDNLVLLGDAAHTAHFSIGSGTKLAMEDAIALADAVDQHPTIARALAEYEIERRPAVEALQEAARESRAYFERVGEYRHLAPEQFTFHLLTRSGRISYDDLRVRDGRFVARVDRWFVAHAAAPNGREAPAPSITPPPLFAPLHLRDLALPNRLAVAASATEDASDGTLTARQQAALLAAATTGAGLVLAPLAAVRAEGRITLGSPGLYRTEHLSTWKRAIARVHAQSGAKVMLSLGHAGPRGATRPRAAGLDRSLRDGAWPLLAASALPYTPQSQIPRAMTRDDMERVRDAYAAAAKLAAEADAGLLEVHMAHGYLLASFLSPLTNRRDDEYGGALEGRLRFPLEVFDAVRAAWPAKRPVAAALNASDWQPGGFDIADAMVVATALKERGCDLVRVLAGQTTPAAQPPYGRGFLTPLADRIRNGAHIPVLVGGYLTTTGEINALLASGRADLCLMELADQGG
ncbi:MAG TPA: FAD-dependent monooxygenase, partial [Ktedonobacterales bacterium]